MLRILILISLCLAVSGITLNIPGLGSLLGGETSGAFTGRTIHQFLGIKYAEPPSGFLRFKPPVAAFPWTGTRDATQTARGCPTFMNRIVNPANDTGDIEDCLHLSVYTTDVSASRPVMVYFHGGGFFEGAASQYPPNYLLEEDVVLVVPQYRLGAFGFLSTLSAGIPGNVALLDCLMALQWVQRHISHFGGDPRRVTIFGQSAGAGIVSGLMISPSVPDNLFHAAILQSGSAFGSWVVDERPLENAQDIGRIGGCEKNASLAQLNECFMQMDVNTLILAFTTHKALATMTGIHTVGGCRFTIGGPTDLFPFSPFKLMRIGEGRRKIPVLAGVTKHDGTFSLAGAYDILEMTIGVNDPQFNAFQLVDTINQLLGLDDATNSLAGFEVAALFDSDSDVLARGDFLEMIDALVDISSVLVIKGPTFRAAQAQAIHNPEQTFLYSFDYRGEFTRFGYGADTSHYPFDGGVHHSNDNIYLFPWPETVAHLNERDTQMARRMVKLWTSFATEGVPSAPGVEHWPPMTRVNGPYMHLDWTSSVGENFFDEYKVTVRDGLRKESLRRNNNGN